MASIPERQYLQASADADVDTAAAQRQQRSRSCSGVSSDLSATSSRSSSSPNRPLSTTSGGSGGGGGGSPFSSRTLVQPRPWRIVHRSRLSASLERESRALEEDTALEGDEQRKKEEGGGGGGEDEEGSSVDGDLVVMMRRRKGREEGVGGDPGERLQEATNGGGGSSVDAVVRTKSESDIAIQKVLSNGDAPRMVVFKSKAKRFSLKDDPQSSQQKTSPRSKSQTLPLSLPPQLLAAAAGYSDIPDSRNATTPADKSSLQSPLSSVPPRLALWAGQGTSKPRQVEGTKSAPLSPQSLWSRAEDSRHTEDRRHAEENRRHSLHGGGSSPTGRHSLHGGGSSPTENTKNVSDTESDDAVVLLAAAKPDRSSALWDSPSRSITLDTQDSSARLSLTLPEDSSRRSVILDTSPRSEQPVKTAELQATSSSKPSKDRPQVPAKPARRSSLNATTSTSDRSMSLPSSPARAASTTQGPPKPPRTTLDHSRRSSSLGSPKTPMETVLFSMGFTVLDDSPKPPTSSQTHTGSPRRQPRPKGDVFDFPMNTEENGQAHETKDLALSTDTVLQVEPESGDRNVFMGNGEGHPRLVLPPAELTVPKTDTEPVILYEIAAKKMTKIKGDKKAEEKAAKAKKKEQKTKEKETKAKEKEMKAKEKEFKAKMKAWTKDERHHDRRRGKPFPWKMEFPSTKDKTLEEIMAMFKANGDGGMDGGGRGVTEGGEQRETAAPVRTMELAPSPLPENVGPETDSLQNGADTTTTTTTTSSSSSQKRTDRGLAARDDGVGRSGKSPSDTSSSQEPSPSTPSPQKEHPQSPEQQLSPKDEPELLLQQQQQQQEQEQQQQQQQQQHSPSSSSTSSPPPRQPKTEVEDSPSHKPSPPVPVGSEPHPPHPSPKPSPQPQRHEGVHDSIPSSPRSRHPYADDVSSSELSSDMESLSGSLRRKLRQERAPPGSVSESEWEATSPDFYGQGRRSGGTPMRYTGGGAQIGDQMSGREVVVMMFRLTKRVLKVVVMMFRLTKRVLKVVVMMFRLTKRVLKVVVMMFRLTKRVLKVVVMMFRLTKRVLKVVVMMFRLTKRVLKVVVMMFRLTKRVLKVVVMMFRLTKRVLKVVVMMFRLTKRVLKVVVMMFRLTKRVLKGVVMMFRLTKRVLKVVVMMFRLTKRVLKGVVMMVVVVVVGGGVHH
ncbi:hypothetical protein ACOMHN_025780 [Nucella lapillus]